MLSPLLATKFFVPPPGKFVVERPRLFKRLDECLHPSCRLALIAAPAGFGKTTLLSNWATGCGQPVSWLSLDEGDNDPLRFLAYTVAAAAKIEAKPGLDILKAIQSPQPPALAELLPVVVAQFEAISRPFVLVFDDYHLISCAEIHKAVTFLIQHLPPYMHIIIATRRDPPLPIPLLRARGQLIELRQADLRFTLEETAAFLKMGIGCELSSEDIASLSSRADGWVAGLQMATLSIRGREDAPRLIANFSGSHQYIVDYFATEVLVQQPEPLKSFLLQTSVLKQMCGSLCDAVTGQSGGQQTLEQLQQANMFIVDLDSDRTWYRYHNLFKDLLSKQLRQETPEIVSELHRRASDWYEHHKLMEGAIDHALQAEEFDRAANLIGEALADSFWKHGETTTILRWLEALPDERIYSRPYLCAFHALGLFLTGQLDKAEKRLHDAERFIEQQPLPGELPESGEGGRDEQKGVIAAVRAYIAYFQGDGPAIIKYAHQALDLLPEENTMWRNSAAINLGDAYSVNGNLPAAQQAYFEALKASRSSGNIFLGLLAGTKLASTLRMQGQLRSAVEICQQLMRLANTDEPPNSEMTGKVYTIWGDILCEWNELEKAETYLRKAVKLCFREGNVAALGLAYLYLLRVLLARQNIDAMEETIQKLEMLAQESHVPVWIDRNIIAWKSWVWIIRGRLAEAHQILDEAGISAEIGPVFRGEGEYLSLARLMIAEGRPAEAGRLLDQLYAAAEVNGMFVWRIVFLSMRALAYEAQGLREAAIATLKQALSLAEAEGYVQIFLEAGQPMAHLIHEVAARGFAPQYTGKLLTAFTGHPPAFDRPSVAANEMIEPLSQRELEVARLLAVGLTNQEIANRLYLSLRTIKFHTGNIYGKLGVKNRVEAVARAQALGLLSE